MYILCIAKSGCSLLIRPFIYSFFFLSNHVSNIKIFVDFFSGTVSPRRFKLRTHVNSGWMYRVYRNQTATSYLSLYFFIFLSNFQTFSFFIAYMYFSGTVSPRKLRPSPIAQLVECPLRGTGGHGFDPGPRHTKVVKNGSSCSSLGTQTYGVELGLVDPVSG